MPTIRLTRGKEAIVSEEDYAYLMQWKWCLLTSKRSSCAYAMRKTRTGENGGKQRNIQMHRSIIERMNGEPIGKGVEVDHINMDGLDNRRENLRLVTRGQNNANKKSSRNSRSKYKGVSWHKARRKWQATTRFREERFHLGYFSTEEEAAKAYDAKAEELFGKFARLNFPTG